MNGFLYFLFTCKSVRKGYSRDGPIHEAGERSADALIRAILRRRNLELADEGIRAPS